MRVLKTILYLFLAVIAVALLAFSGLFLWQAIPKQEKEPEVLQSDLIFQEEEPAPSTEEQRPAEEAPVEAEATEETVAEEVPVEEAAAEEAPEVIVAETDSVAAEEDFAE